MADDKVKKANKVYQKAVDNGMPTEAKQVTKVSGDLAKFYSKYLADVNLQLEKWLESYSSLSFSQKLQVERLLNVKNTINNIIGEPSTNIKQTIQDFVQTQGKQAYDSVWYQLEQGYNLSLDFPVLNPNYLEKLMNAPVAGSNLSKRLKDNVDNLAKASNDAIARGFMLGKSYAKIALDISTETQASYNRAVRIARTEGGRVSSLATQKGYEEAVNSGVHMQKMWMATLDSKTRMDHSHVDGQIIDVDGYFNVGGYKALGPHQTGVAREDVNCRCTSRPIVSGISPTVRLDNETKQTTQWQSYSEWSEEKSLTNGSNSSKIRSEDLTQSKITNNVSKGKSIYENVKFEKVDFSTVYHSNEVTNWINDVTKDERDSVGYYTGAGNHSEIKYGDKKYHLSSYQWNDYIMHGKVTGLPEGKEFKKIVSEFFDNHTKNLDSALNKGQSPFNMVSMRGMSRKEFESLGTDGQINSYRSTTIDYDTARQYASENKEYDGSKYLAEFRIPKGSKGALVWQYSMYADEEEWLLPRNARFNKVGDSYIDEDGINRAIFEVITD